MPSLPWRVKQQVSGEVQQTIAKDVLGNSNSNANSYVQEVPRRSSVSWLSRSSTRSSSIAEEPQQQAIQGSQAAQEPQVPQGLKGPQGPQQQQQQMRRGSRQLSIASIGFKKKRRPFNAEDDGELSGQQRQCAMTDKMPFELRELVYLCIMEEEGWTVTLPEQSEDPKERKRLEKMRKKGQTGIKSPAFVDLLSLMRTCRLLHTELETILYERSYIVIPGMPTFEHWISKTTRAQLSSLRNLRLSVNFPYLLFHPREGGPKADKYDPRKMQYYNAKRWETVCSAIHKMSGLRMLEIGMNARDYREMHPNWPDRPAKRLFEVILEPLLDVNWIEDFQIEVTWPIDGFEVAEGARFLLRQKEVVEEDDGGSGDDEESSSESEADEDSDDEGVLLG